MQEIYRRAAEMQSEEVFPAESSATTHGEVKRAAERVGIQEEYVDAAAAQIFAERQQKQREAEQRAANRARLARGLGLGAGGAVLVGGLLCWSAAATLGPAYSRVEASRAQVASVIARREALLPRLVELTRRSEETQKSVAQSLERAMEQKQLSASAGQNPQVERRVNGAASEALSQILAQGGANGELARNLMAEWSGSENRIAVERKKLNEAAAVYNQKARAFPTLLFRPVLGYPGQVSYDVGAGAGAGAVSPN